MKGCFAKNGKPTSILRPDIIMSLNDHIFVMDVKYRRQDMYNGIKDMCEVAFQKYILELENGLDAYQELGIKNWNNRIEGSFIIHSNISNKRNYENKRNQYNTNLYLGMHIDENFKNIWAKEIDYDEKVVIVKDKFKAWCKWMPGINNNNENRLGILSVTPEMNNLYYLIQMLMEKYCCIYKEKCWMCGEKISKKDIKKKILSSGYEKYHITCPGCKRFWVQTHCRNSRCHMTLCKHSKNYYASVSDWNVECPACRNYADRETKWQSKSVVKLLDLDHEFVGESVPF